MTGLTNAARRRARPGRSADRSRSRRRRAAPCRRGLARATATSRAGSLPCVRRRGRTTASVSAAGRPDTRRAARDRAGLAAHRRRSPRTPGRADRSGVAPIFLVMRGPSRISICVPKSAFWMRRGAGGMNGRPYSTIRNRPSTMRPPANHERCQSMRRSLTISVVAPTAATTAASHRAVGGLDLPQP